MKIALNKRYGGFNLPEGFCAQYNITELEDKWSVERTDERLISYIEANGGDTEYGLLKVVEIPDDCSDWELNDYDGFESITYVVDGKLFHI